MQSSSARHRTQAEVIGHAEGRDLCRRSPTKVLGVESGCRSSPRCWPVSPCLVQDLLRGLAGRSDCARRLTACRWHAGISAAGQQLPSPNSALEFVLPRSTTLPCEDYSAGGIVGPVSTLGGIVARPMAPNRGICTESPKSGDANRRHLEPNRRSALP